MLLGMGKLLLPFLLLAWGAISARAQLEDADAATKAKCAEYLKLPLPAEAESIPTPKQWPSCASYKLYSGIGTKVDFGAPRKCAWSERLAAQSGLEPRYTVQSIFGGSAMLTVLYANGEGVEKNLPLASRFSCESGWAPAEISGRLARLESLRSAGSPSKQRFGFCDDITSGAMDGYCAAYRGELEDQTRTNAIGKLASGWPQAHQTAFAKLVQAELTYADLHGRGEIDLAGNSRAAEEIAATQAIKDSFRGAIEAYEVGKSFPQKADAAEADAELNRLYRETISATEAAKSEYGAVQPEGIRNAERAWLKYRDAWVDFARLHYPNVSAEAWLTLLTRDRIATIKGDSCDKNLDGSSCDQSDTVRPRPLP